MKHSSLAVQHHGNDGNAFEYKVGIDPPRDYIFVMIDWCNDNMNGEWDWVYTPPTNKSTTFSFSDLQDATLFRLRF